jgi:6,7-dimethyl-8-ribityllumazine synthase
MAAIENSKLLDKIEGIHQIEDALVVLVKTEWNAAITDELENGCVRVLGQYGVKHLTLVVPGAVEIPFAIRQYANASNRVTAFVALGAVVRGDTPHFDYVCQSVTQGIGALNLSLSVPVIFGVLTVDNQKQAEERIGGVHGHKGEEAALTALKMIILNKEIKDGTLS